jgi:flagellar biosynthesis protein FlhA
VRKKFAQDVGFLPPPVHIRDNLELKPSMYRLTLRGAVVGEGEAFPACGWRSTRAARRRT